MPAPDANAQATDSTSVNPESVYARLGGAPAIAQLVHRFYALMDELPEAWDVRRLHPESLVGSADSLFKYLSGWFGGPPLYVQERGHPRLRMRHHPYRIGVTERDQWMLCMGMALAEQLPDLSLRAAVERAFSDMADHMINSEQPGACPH